MGKVVRFATPMLLVNELLLLAFAVNLAFAGLFRKAGYRLLAGFGDQTTWLIVVVVIAAAIAAGFLWPKVLIAAIPACSAFWAMIALTFAHASTHAIGWELVSGFDVLLICEYARSVEGWADAAQPR